jgi:hypothetical protein
MGVSRRVVYYWARHGLLPGACQINGVWLVDLEVFNAWKGEATKWSGSMKDQKALIGTQKPPLEGLYAASLQESPEGRAIVAGLERRRLKRLLEEQPK